MKYAFNVKIISNIHVREEHNIRNDTTDKYIYIGLYYNHYYYCSTLVYCLQIVYIFCFMFTYFVVVFVEMHAFASSSLFTRLGGRRGSGGSSL